MAEVSRPVGTSTGRIRVILTSLDETRIKAFFLNRSDTVAEAKRLWAREWDCNVASFLFAIGTVALSDDTPFSAMPFSSPGIVELHVDEKISLSVRLFGWEEEEPKTLSVALCTLAQDFCDSARDSFDLGDRPVRLRFEAAVVACGQSLREAGVGARSGVSLELGWRVTERRGGCPDVEATLFHSELLAKVASEQFRLRSATRTASDVAAAEELLRAGSHGRETAHLVLEAAREVAVLQGGSVQTQRTWPQGGLPPECREMLLRGRVVPCGPGLLSALPSLPSCALLLEALRLVGALPGGRRAVLRVPQDGSVRDVLSAAAALEEPHVRLQLLLGGRPLRENAALRSLGLQDRQEVALQRLATKICVRFGRREFAWALPRDREEASFGDIAAGVSARRRAQRRVLLSGFLKCEGCGRRLSRERQEVQRVPAACCELRSMQLCYAVKGLRAIGMQTEPHTRNAEMQAEANSNADAGSQTESQTIAELQIKTDWGTQTELLTATAESQTKSIWSADPSAGIEVTLRLPGDHLTRCRLALGDSLNALIDALRHSGQLLRPDDVILRGRSLMKVPRGRQRTLQEIGVRDGDEFLVTAFLPLPMKVFVPSLRKTFFLALGRGENCWDSIKSKLALPAGRDFNVVAQERLFYRRAEEWRCAGSHHLNGRYTYLDEEDGEEVRSNALLVREFFAPEVGFRAAPRGVPRVWAFDELLGFEDGRLVTLEPRALFNPVYVACVEGIQSFSNEDVARRLFIQTGDAGFFECSTNTTSTFKDSDEICCTVGFKKLTMRWIYLLFRENDAIPRWPLPREKLILVFKRHGVDLKISNNRLCRTAPSWLRVADSCWSCPSKPDAFQEEFSKCVRRKEKHRNSL